MENKEYGYFTITDDPPFKRDVNVTCICGEVRKVRLSFLRNGRSKSCGCKSKENRAKTNIERHGFENAMQNPAIKQKAANTCTAIYGVDNISKLESVKKHKEENSLAKFGTKSPLQSEVVKNKTEETNLRKFGCKSVSQNKQVREKAEATMMARFDVKHALQNKDLKKKAEETTEQNWGNSVPLRVPELKAKQEATMLAKYNTKHALQVPEIVEKMQEDKVNGGYQSIGEKSMRDWIESHGYTTYKKFYGGGPNVKCEIDIVIPDARLSVEYHGDILHSEFIKNRGCGYHLNKTVQSKRRDGYHLIHVFESEWKHSKDQVKAFILGYLTKGVPIRASKCEVKEIDNNLAYDFCNQYHLQGKPHGAILSLGLYYQNELLSVMTFSKPHRQNMGSEPHLSRYITKTGYRVHGGLSKLSQYAYSKLGEFITFVHLRLSSGDSYLKAGYEVIKTLPPDYWYWDNKKNKKVLKQARRKSAVNTPEGMTESEHAQLDGLYRIWDCGKIKLKFSMKKSDKIV